MVTKLSGDYEADLINFFHQKEFFFIENGSGKIETSINHALKNFEMVTASGSLPPPPPPPPPHTPHTPYNIYINIYIYIFFFFSFNFLFSFF